MKGHQMFAEVMKHLVCDIGQLQDLASQDIFGKTDDPGETPGDLNTELGDHASKAVNQLSTLADQQITRTME